MNHRHAPLDALRGLVIVLMALDHTRGFIQPMGLDPTNWSSTTIPFFLSRWVTHLCAPTFVFLMGAGAALRASRKPDDTPRFLLSRGLWLVLLEVTWVSFAFSWQVGWTYLGVLWALGGSMVLLAPLTRVSGRVLMGVGIGITVLLAAWPAAADLPWIGMLFGPKSLSVLGHPVRQVYALVPWFAVAACGFGLSNWLTRTAPRTLAGAGVGLLSLFAILRTWQWGDPRPWNLSERGLWFTGADFINPSKYPPSLLYLLLTIGVALLILGGPARGNGPIARWLQVLGRVPMFFYLAHLPLAHLVGNAWAWANHGSFQVPEGTPLSMTVILGAWVFVVALLTPVCIAWRRLKERRPDLGWLKYL